MVIYTSTLILILFLFCYRLLLFTPAPWFSFCRYFLIDHGYLHQHLDSWSIININKIKNKDAEHFSASLSDYLSTSIMFTSYSKIHNWNIAKSGVKHHYTNSNLLSPNLEPTTNILHLRATRNTHIFVACTSRH
jgi:hypothetical protein